MSLMDWLREHMPGSKRRAEIDERIRAAEALERRVAGLTARADRIMSENHLGLAIRRALEGP